MQIEPSKEETPFFDSIQEAKDWADEQVDDPCKDNSRFAFADDDVAMALYHEQERTGCCGSVDYVVFVNGRVAWVGFNYGH